MAEITAALVKELRERTGQGMMDCKKALTAAGGDIEKAIDDMRAAGAIKAAKKAGNIAAEGAIAVKVADDNKRAVIIEVNSQTDFLALQDDFKNFVSSSVGRTAAATAPGSAESANSCHIKATASAEIGGESSSKRNPIPSASESAASAAKDDSERVRSSSRTQKKTTSRLRSQRTASV
ncbi:MAG: translation elongation factor Ts [Myxococcales bacterium]|nr:translation elongation factor Ts [Myxococcales bacterium]